MGEPVFMPIADIRLRPPLSSDAPLVLEAARESVAEIFPWMPWCSPDYDLARSQTWIDSCIQGLRDRTSFEFIIENADGHLLGACGVNQLHPEYPMANLGYWVRSSATRQGVASRAARMAADWAFHNTTLERLEIVVAIDNLPSQKAALKAGAHREGTLRSRLSLHGVLHDAVLFSMIRTDR